MAENAFLEHLEEQILENLSLGPNRGGVFMSLKYVLVCQKNS